MAELLGGVAAAEQADAQQDRAMRHPPRSVMDFGKIQPIFLDVEL
ncbi:hypothetical protein [Mesorhizobium sp. M0204]